MPNLGVFLLLFVLFSASHACPDGYFSQENDCDTQGTLLQHGDYTSQKIFDNNWTYFFLPFNGTEGRHIVLEIEKEGGSFKVFIQVKAISLKHEFYLEEDNKPLSFYVPISQKGGDLVVGVQNENVENLMETGVKIRCFTEDEYNKLSEAERKGKSKEISRLQGGFHVTSFSFGMFFGITAGVAFALTMGVGVYLLCLRESRPLPRFAQQTDLLSAEEIEKFFPKAVFGTLKNNFHQNACSICLEKFENNTECRQLICGHIYNDICAHNWLSKNNNCPDCRRPVTKQAIEEFLKAKDDHVDQKESANVTLIPQNDSIIEVETATIEKKVLLGSV